MIEFMFNEEVNDKIIVKVFKEQGTNRLILCPMYSDNTYLNDVRFSLHSDRTDDDDYLKAEAGDLFRRMVTRSHYKMLEEYSYSSIVNVLRKIAYRI